MTKPHAPFVVYDATMPARVRVCRTYKFSEQAAAMFQAHLPQSRAWFANLHEFIVRLATGQPLSSEAFRQEGPGYAFRSGRIRLYGGYSLKHKGHFVLSHPTYKTKQKLSTADAQKIEQCIREFDELDIPPKV